MERTIIKTADGSHSLFVKHLNEHYHSIHGAIQESNHVFINSGLKHILSQQNRQLTILEIGFGTGLNALLTFIETYNLNIQINFSALEAYPLNTELTNKLNYIDLLNTELNKSTMNLKTIFNQLHACEWDKPIEISDFFNIHKIKNTLQKIVFDKKFDLIYFDAFGPAIQPEMWTEEIFNKIAEATKPNGCLVTYCAKGEVKRTLKKVGFTIESLQGPPGKREMIRAIKN